MTKWLIVPLALSCALAGAQTAAVPTSRPHQNFVDNSGSPCALCTLSSFAAGTTTPQPTYTDSTKTSQNTNPITLDVAGGANIWLDPALLYKFVLKDALGSTIWTVDNVPGSGSGGALPCSTAFAVQIASSDAKALTCDPTITINTTSHTLMVGGPISGPQFTMKNLTTIPFSWTLDVTTPTTTLNSLGAIPLGNLQQIPSDTFVGNTSGGSGAPVASPLPSCSNGINYSYSTHSWTCVGTIPLSQLAQQGPDTVVMNPTGATAAPVPQTLPTGCTVGVNYDTTSHTWSCVNAATPAVCSGGSCYRTDADGTIEEWGNQFCGSVSCTINFPSAFPSSTNLAFNVTAVYGVQGNLVTVASSLNTNSVVVTTGAVVYNGGGGAGYSGGATYSWHAIQHN